MSEPSQTFTRYITFENEEATFKPPLRRPPGALTELDLSINALQRRGILIRGGVPFDIITNEGNSSKHLDFRRRSIDPFYNQTDNTPFRLQFNVGNIKTVGLQAGDYGDDADTIVLKAFSKDGKLVGQSSAFLRGGGRSFTKASLEVTSNSGEDIDYIEFIGGSSRFPNSVFYDNIYYTFGEINFSDPTKFSTNIPTSSPVINDPVEIADFLSKLFSLVGGTGGFKDGLKFGSAQLGVSAFNIPGLSLLGIGLDAARVGGQTFATNIGIVVEAMRQATQNYANQNQNQLSDLPDLEVRNNQENVSEGSAFSETISGTDSENIEVDDYISGQAGDDILEGGKGYDALFGDAGSDFLSGGEGSDVLNGSTSNFLNPNASASSTGQVDTLTGGTGIDFFVLGDAKGVYYDDEETTASKIESYAVITDFNTQEDFLILKKDFNYIFETNQSGLSIYLDDDGQKGLTADDELIAQLNGITTINPGDFLTV